MLRDFRYEYAPDNDLIREWTADVSYLWLDRVYNGACCDCPHRARANGPNNGHRMLIDYSKFSLTGSCCACDGAQVLLWQLYLEFGSAAKLPCH